MYFLPWKVWSCHKCDKTHYCNPEGVDSEREEQILGASHTIVERGYILGGRDIFLECRR